jgi:serine/threonine-protein kinase
MGVVYCATELALDRTVALKLIAPELGADADFRARFWREAKIAAALEHPNVLPIFKAGEEDGTLFISMRYIEGSDLAHRLETGPLESAVAVAIVGQVAEALDAAHARGLIHRDVKPSNILLDRDGPDERAYLSDFGLAKVTASDTGLTRTGQLLGTLDYVSPEQIRGEPLAPTSDVYSLGCVLFQTLTGRVPFALGDDLARLWAHMHEPPPYLADLSPELPKELDDVIQRSLAKLPEERFSSAGELGQAAAAALRPAHITRSSRLRTPWQRQRHRSLRRRHLWAVVTALGIVVGGLAIATVVIRVNDAERQSGEAPNVGAAISVPIRPDRLAAAGGFIWALSREGGRLVRVDPESGRAESYAAPIDLGGGLHPDLAGDPDALWLAHANPTVGGVDHIRPDTVEAVERVPLPAATALAVAKDAVWATTLPESGSPGRLGLLARIDPRSNRLSRPPGPVGREPVDVAVGLDAIWIADRARNEVVRVSPRTLRIEARIRVGAGPSVLAVTGAFVWVANSTDRALTRIDPGRNETVGAPVEIGKEIDDLVAGAGSLWLAGGDGTVTELDSTSGAVLGTPLRVGASPLSLTWDGSQLWVASAPDQAVRPLSP